MNAKKLSNRLALAADFVTENAVVADIGTDHGSLPIFLVSSGKCPKAIASDLRKGPLASAKSNIKTAGLSNVIETRLSDGLKSIKKDEFDEAVMAGMAEYSSAKYSKTALTEKASPLYSSPCPTPTFCGGGLQKRL